MKNNRHDYLGLVAFAAFVIVSSLVIRSAAQERITLTTPEALPSNTEYRVDDFSLKPDDPDIIADTGVLTIRLISVPRRETVTCVYTPSTNPTGTFLINALNKSNLSSVYNNNATTGSLTQRIFHRLFSGGLNEGPAICGRALTGTLTGSPQ